MICATEAGIPYTSPFVGDLYFEGLTVEKDYTKAATCYEQGFQHLNPHQIVRLGSTYIAYRKAGYSKKFKQKHESDILVHQTAKKFFDELGLEKLPTVKSLQKEYSDLLSRKKEIYPEYRKLRTEMKDLLTAKANVDRLLSIDAQSGKEEQNKQR